MSSKKEGTFFTRKHSHACVYMYSVTVVVVGNGIGDPSSNLGQVCLYFLLH